MAPQQQQTDALAIRAEDGAIALAQVPANIREARVHATMLLKSTFLPNDLRSNVANLYMVIMRGAELGLSPSHAVESIIPIHGNLGMKAEAMLAVCESTGQLIEFEETGSFDGPKENWSATARAVRKKPDGTVRKGEETFTMDDARTAGLVTRSGDKGRGAGAWVAWPKRMLKQRARAFLLRDMFADILKGMISADEAEEIAPKNVTPKAVQERVPAQPAAQRPDMPKPKVVDVEPAAEPETVQPQKPADPPKAATVATSRNEAVPPTPETTAAPAETKRAPNETKPAAGETPEPEPASLLERGTVVTQQSGVQVIEEDLLGDALGPQAGDGTDTLVSKLQRGEFLTEAYGAGWIDSDVADFLETEIGVSEAKLIPVGMFAKAMEWAKKGPGK